MDPVSAVVDKLSGLAKSAQDFASGLLNWRRNGNRRRPIDILKRLQREAFSDIMKIRDRQEKVERLLTLSNRGPFREASTHVTGKVDVLGALFFMDIVDEQKHDTVLRSGIRTGIDARLAFESRVRDRDTLTAEFVASERGQGDAIGGPLSLAKVMYTAHVGDWFSAIAIPMGGRCRDVDVATSSRQGWALTDYSELGPPLLNQYAGSGVGIMVQKSNMVASLAQFVSRLGMLHNTTETMRLSTTFGQVSWKFPRNMRLSLVGVHRESKRWEQNVNLGALAFPVNIFKRNWFSDTTVEEDITTLGERHSLDGSVALMVDTELDESTRIGGWIEMKSSNPRYTQWAVTLCGTPEDEFGVGLTVGGSLQGPENFEHFQVESFLNLNVGNKFKLRPGLLYVKDGSTQFPALMLHSSWSL